MKKPWFHKWEQEKDISSAMLRHESQQVSPTEANSRLGRLLRKNVDLLRYVTFSVRSNIDTGNGCSLEKTTATMKNPLS